MQRLRERRMASVFRKNLIWSLLSVAFLFAVWQLACRRADNGYLIPSVPESLSAMGRLLTEGGFWRAFSQTFLRTLNAFFISFLLALFFSIVSYLVPAIGRFLSPVISFLRSLPTMAVLLLLLVWTTPKEAPVIVAFLALFPILYAGMSAAFSAVPSDLIEMSRVYKVPLWRRIVRLYLPFAAPYVLRESASALSFSLKLVVSAEVLANTAQSLGGMLQEARIFLEMPRMFALTLVTVAAGFFLECLGSAFAYLSGRTLWS